MNRATDAQITKRLEYIDATLPTRKSDDVNGKRRATVYVSILRDFSDDAIAFMVREACATLDWFPSPRQCLAILENYIAPMSARENALRLCHDFAEDAFGRWMDNIREGQPVGDVPEQWVRIAIEQGHLRRLDGGVIVARSFYHGPFRSINAVA